MSGGRWNYMSEKLEAAARANGEVWRLMAALEHELDWGLSGDTCADCAKRRTVCALVAFFDCDCEDATAAIALARDGRQPTMFCERCAEHATQREVKTPGVA